MEDRIWHELRKQYGDKIDTMTREELMEAVSRYAYTFNPTKHKQKNKGKVLLSVTQSDIVMIDYYAKKYSMTRSDFILQCVCYAIAHIQGDDHA